MLFKVCRCGCSNRANRQGGSDGSPDLGIIVVSAADDLDFDQVNVQTVPGSGVQRVGKTLTTILIVEDEEQVRVLTESYLRDQGHHTLSAATMEQALAVLDGRNNIDVLFVDVELDEARQAGLELARQAVTRKPELRVLYTTKQEVTDGMRALLVEKSALLPKPYTVEQLQATLAVSFGVKPAAA
jgi:CheY-like chemotaxis protein